MCWRTFCSEGLLLGRIDAAAALRRSAPRHQIDGRCRPGRAGPIRWRAGRCRPLALGSLPDGRASRLGRRRLVGGAGFPHHHVATVGDALQRFGAHRPRRREQEALTEADVVIEQVDHHRFAFDLLGDQVDAETAEEIGQVGGVDVGGAVLGIDQQVAGDLDVAEAARREVARLDPQVLQVVEREPEAAVGQRGQQLVLHRAGGAQSALGELEHDRRRDRAIGVEEVEELLKHRAVGEGRFREIAEQADIAVLEQQPPHHLHAAEDDEIVDLRHQSGALRQRDEIGGLQDVAGLGAQPRHRLVVAHFPLRQRHDRLQIEVDAIGIDGAPDHRKPFLVDAVGVGAVGVSDDSGRDRRCGLRLGSRRWRGHRDRRRGHRRNDVLHQRRDRFDHRDRLLRQRLQRLCDLGRCDLGRCDLGRCDLAEPRLVGRHRFRELPHQRAELADLDRERVDRGACPRLGDVRTAFHPGDPAVEVVDLARQLEIAAREIAELAADRGTDAAPG